MQMEPSEYDPVALDAMLMKFLLGEDGLDFEVKVGEEWDNKSTNRLG